jgi:hypothetical protein
VADAEGSPGRSVSCRSYLWPVPYTYHVGRFAEFLGRSPEHATPEDVRSFQLRLINERKVLWNDENPRSH